MTTEAPKIYTIQELTPRQKALIKASVPILKLSGEVLTAQFYQKMLSENPVVRPFFNETDQKLLRQPKILAFALLAYAQNIDDLAPLSDFVHGIVVKHVGLQIEPEHYPIVGSCLLATMAKLLGPETADKEFLKAWETAYGNLAQLLINAEHAAYQTLGWSGFRDFKVTRLVKESSDVQSVYFAPVEGKITVPKRGQYVCIRWKLPGAENERSREYSLSMFPENNEYRISVRLLPGGVVSTYIHNGLKVGDLLRVAPPCGRLTYKSGEKDVIMFVGGIGITPLVSVMEEALREGRKVTLFNSNRTELSRPFGGFLRKLKGEYGPQLSVAEFFSNDPKACGIEATANRALQSGDFDGLDYSRQNDIYMLGPPGYMKFVMGELARNGVGNGDVATETFGPTVV